MMGAATSSRTSSRNKWSTSIWSDSFTEVLSLCRMESIHLLAVINPLVLLNVFYFGDKEVLWDTIKRWDSLTNSIFHSTVFPGAIFKSLVSPLKFYLCVEVKLFHETVNRYQLPTSIRKTKTGRIKRECMYCLPEILPLSCGLVHNVLPNLKLLEWLLLGKHHLTFGFTDGTAAVESLDGVLPQVGLGPASV